MKILLIEDEKPLSDALCQIFSKKRWETFAAYNGETGLDEALTGIYDIILLDIMLPKLDGLTVLQRLREASISTPVLLLSAKGETSDKVAGLDCGADDYLAKPFATEELLARIRAMTRSPLAKEPNRLSMGNVSLDLASYELSTPAGSFRLTSKEFQMMEMLLANPRRLIPTERFLEKIWGYDTEAEIHVVWVYISYLRKKLASLQANVQIRVARNAGYSLEEIP